MRLVLVLLMAVALGCDAGPSAARSPTLGGTDPSPTPSATPAVAPTPAQPGPPLAMLSRAELAGLADPAISAAVADLLRRAGSVPELQVLRAARATWRDASLGCPEPGRAYAQVLTQGLWLVFAAGGAVYDYRVAGGQPTLCQQGQAQEPAGLAPLEGLWSRLSRVSTARSEVAVAALDGKVYVMGGQGSAATANEEYDPTTDTWRQRAPIPQGVDHAAAVALEGRIYLIGGFRGNFQPINTTWAYDPASDSWERKADLPTLRGALGAVAVGGSIYAIGGRGTQGDVGTVEVYDPAADSWSAAPDMPTPRDHVAIALVDGKIYVIGGRLTTFARNLGTSEAFDPATGAWTRRAPLPTARSGIAAGVVDGKIYVFGGEATQGTFDENESYDPVTDTWKAMPPMPTARHGLGAAAIGQRIYTLAGGPTPGGSRSDRNEVFIVLGAGQADAQR